MSNNSMNKFIELLTSYFNKIISDEEFIQKYIALRAEELIKGHVDHQIIEERVRVSKNFQMGLITEKQYKQEIEKIDQSIITRSDMHPFSREAEILLYELFSAIDAFEAPVEIYKEHVVSKKELRKKVQKALEELRELGHLENNGVDD